MSNIKRAKYYELIIQGLREANKGSPFWTKSDAMTSLNMYRVAVRKQEQQERAA